MVYTRPDSRYPKNWNRRRWAIFKSYDYTCQVCGKYSKGNLDLHHIVPLGDGGNNHSSNLIPVCRKCHMKIHEKLKKAKKNGIR